MSDPQEISSTSQEFLEVFDITRNAVVLKDGTVSIILVISAMNFGLLAEQEQDAIIYAYAALLNSLNFPIQILIRSKTKDATSYLNLLETQANKASSNEKRALIRRYQDFVGRLIKERNVLDKKFYVVIPAQPAEVGMMTAESVLPGKTAPQLTRDKKAAVLEKALGILEPRRDHIISQFNRIGLYARQIETQEIIEVFYSSYNPEAREGQQITDGMNYTTMMVGAKTSLPRTPAVSPEASGDASGDVGGGEKTEEAPGYAKEAEVPVQQMPANVVEAPEPALVEQPLVAEQPIPVTLARSVPAATPETAVVPIKPVSPPVASVPVQEPVAPITLPPVAEL